MKFISNQLSNKDSKEICRLYKNKIMSIEKICQKYHICPNTLYKILHKSKITLRGNSLLEEEQEKIVELYKKGYTIYQIQKKLKLGKSSISKYLKVNGIKTRKDSGIFKTKYKIDDGLLKRIDSKEKAQFLGLLYSDGSLSNYNKAISIRLREDDAEYLNKWRTKLVKTNKPLYFSRTAKKMISPLNGKKYKLKYGLAILDITNKKIYNDALKIGLCPNKTSKNIGMPDIAKKYIPYFILGLFEGDGCITYCSKSCSFTIACQKKMASDLYNYFSSIGIKSHNYVRKSINIIQVNQQKDLIKIFDMFYKNPSSVIMQRKYKKYKRIIQIIS